MTNTNEQFSSFNETIYAIVSSFKKVSNSATLLAQFADTKLFQLSKAQKQARFPVSFIPHYSNNHILAAN